MFRKSLTISIIFFSVLYIFFIPAESEVFKIFMKIIPMALIITLAFQTETSLPKLYKKWILLGLTICMIADAVIYWFLPGLITFFIGHIIYIIAFQKIWHAQIPKWVAGLLLLYGILMAIWLVSTQLKIGETVLAFAILAYIAVILVMGWHAIASRLSFAIIGAVLFIISDSALAIDRFITPLPYRDALVMITYYAAQFFIAKSVGNHLIKHSVNRRNLIK